MQKYRKYVCYEWKSRVHNCICSMLHKLPNSVYRGKNAKMLIVGVLVSLFLRFLKVYLKWKIMYFDLICLLLLKDWGAFILQLLVIGVAPRCMLLFLNCCFLNPPSLPREYQVNESSKWAGLMDPLLCNLVWIFIRSVGIWVCSDKASLFYHRWWLRALVLGSELSSPTLGKLFKLSEFLSFIYQMFIACSLCYRHQGRHWTNQTKILALVWLTYNE